MLKKFSRFDPVPIALSGLGCCCAWKQGSRLRPASAGGRRQEYGQGPAAASIASRRFGTEGRPPAGRGAGYRPRGSGPLGPHGAARGRVLLRFFTVELQARR